MARRMIPAKLEEQLQKLNSNISEDGKLYLDGIVDADGHQRFIDFNLTQAEITGVSLDYGKASLSGTHLLIVELITIVAETSITSSDVLGEIELPKWIYDKIAPLWSSVVFYETVSGRDSGGSAQQVQFALTKAGDNKLNIRTLGTATITSSDKKFRIAFDLLIDTEAGE